MNKTSIIFLHGLCGHGNEFNKLINSLKTKFHKSINFINITRNDTGIKSLEEQALEIEREVKNIADIKKNNVIIIGHSQGSIISLILCKNLINQNILVSKLILIGTPFLGFDCVKNHFAFFRQKYDGELIDFLEQNIICYKLKDNPKGIIGLMNRNLLPILEDADKLISLQKISTHIFVCTKPENFILPESLWSFIMKNASLLKKKNRFSLRKILFSLAAIFNPKTYKYLYDLKKLYKEHFFNPDYITDQKENDLMVGKDDQRWPFENNFVEHYYCTDVVHNRKLSLMLKNLNYNVQPELESDFFLYMILQIIKS